MKKIIIEIKNLLKCTKFTSYTFFSRNELEDLQLQCFVSQEELQNFLTKLNFLLNETGN